MGARKQSQLSVTDLFCGAGGSSIGAEAAGASLLLGINHWPQAIETHSTNFPEADHDCQDVSLTHPGRYRSTHLLIASPECTTWTQARGRRRNFGAQTALGEDFEPLPSEAEERSRATMWDVVRFAEHHRYEAVVVENVVDVWPWALTPVWLQAMDTLGYQHRALWLNSMFFDAVPQSRDRLYVVFWRRGNRAPALDYRPRAWCSNCASDVAAVQVWKRGRRAGRFRQQYVYACPACGVEAAPYVWPAALAIDWSLRGERIGDRRKPLAAATMARIRAGIAKYWRSPGLVDVTMSYRGHGYDRARSVGEPMATQTGQHSKALYAPPLVVELRGTSSGQLQSTARPTGRPLGAVTAGGNHHGLVRPPLYIKSFGGPEDAGPMTHPVSDPLGCITAIDHHALPRPPLMVPMNGGRHGDGGHAVRTVTEPLLTQTGDLARSLVVSDNGREGTVTATRRAVGGVTATVATGLVVPTAQTGPHRHNRARSTSEPLPTQTTAQGDAVVRPPVALALLAPYNRTGAATPVHAPMGTLTSHDRYALVAGREIAVEDCLFRMLEPHEIRRGMAFPDDYVVLGHKRARVRQLGQAVTPPVMEWIIGRVVESLR